MRCRQGGRAIIPSFSVSGFRGFRQLTIPRLARVNLVVGKNNVGKTMLLEALRLYATRGSVGAIRQILADRDDVAMEAGFSDDLPAEERDRLRLLSLFTTPLDPGAEPAACMGELGETESNLGIRLVRTQTAEVTTTAPPAYQTNTTTTPPFQPSTFTVRQVESRDWGLYILASPSRMVWNASTFRFSSTNQFVEMNAAATKVVWVSAQFTHSRELARWWDRISLSDGERRVLDCMSIIEKIDRLNFIEHPHRPGERIPMIRVPGSQEAIPLRRMGDGLYRLFQIACALERAVSTEGGLLLIDEIENGLHYSKHAEVWTVIIRAASERNVQVVATTHSWDCIRGLRAALPEVPEADVQMFRLERLKDRHVAVRFERKELPIVADSEIEVR